MDGADETGLRAVTGLREDNAETAAGAIAVRRPNGYIRWTKELEGLFLDHLSATGNVSASARMIGVTHHNVYYRHRTNPVFAAGWDQALAAGYRTVEARMIEHLLSAETFDWDKALRMLTQRAALMEKGYRGGPAPKAAAREDTDATIMKRLAALAARRARDDERGAPS